MREMSLDSSANTETREGLLRGQGSSPGCLQVRRRGKPIAEPSPPRARTGVCWRVEDFPLLQWSPRLFRARVHGDGSRSNKPTVGICITTMSSIRASLCWFLVDVISASVRVWLLATPDAFESTTLQILT